MKTVTAIIIAVIIIATIIVILYLDWDMFSNKISNPPKSVTVFDILLKNLKEHS
jgi:hypothetical protein